MKNIIIGTAQFGQKYGISKNNKKTKLIEQKKIIKLAYKNNFKILDSALYYGNISKVLNKFKLNKFQIILKIKSIDILKFIKKFNENYAIFDKKIIKKFHKNTNIILLYDFDKLSESKKKKVFQFMKNLIKKKIIIKFGYTVYDFFKIKDMCTKYQPNIIQCPFNIIDRRLSEKKLINYFKKNKIEIHVRSIFLQGLLLMNKNQLSKKFKNYEKFKKLFDDLDVWISQKKISRVEACVNFVKKYKNIDYYVIGFHKLDELKEVVYSKNLKLEYPKVSSTNRKLINPSYW